MLAKRVSWSMAEQSIELRNCCKFRTSVPAKIADLQGNKLTCSLERQRLIIANILAYKLC